jgi:acetoin utilization deacetylase AcuC-like enzyme
MRLFRSSPCKIVYRSEYLTTLHSRNSYNSFDPQRFKKIRDQLVKDHLIRKRNILEAEPVGNEDILRVHTKEYLESLRNPMVVGKILNLDYVDPWDSYILEHFRFVVGGTLLATRYALEENTTVFNLGGGYHHAHPDRGEGYCLLNDVAITIEKYLSQNKIRRVLVIDLDYHQGNGILLFYKDNPNVFTFSVHAESWDNVEKENNIDIELPSGSGDEKYLETLRNQIPLILKNFTPDLIIYLAGSDPYREDALGDFNISEEGMLERDAFVYSQVRSHNVPLVVLAAGGYGLQSWKIYYNFIKWVVKKG